VNSAAIDWTSDDAEALRTALGPRAGEEDGPLGYCQLAGFLFAVACSPELVAPSEWLPIVLGEDMDALDLEADLDAVLALVTRLHNHINFQVLEGSPSPPAGVEERAELMDNFAADAPLAQWASGFSHGQNWLADTWDAYLDEEPAKEARAHDQALAAVMVVLGFFASREFAEGCLAQMRGAGPLEEMAPKMLDLLPEAMRELAQLGRL
jgi:uncharacterized protein